MHVFKRDSNIISPGGGRILPDYNNYQWDLISTKLLVDIKDGTEI